MARHCRRITILVLVVVQLMATSHLRIGDPRLHTLRRASAEARTAYRNYVVHRSLLSLDECKKVDEVAGTFDLVDGIVTNGRDPTGSMKSASRLLAAYGTTAFI